MFVSRKTCPSNSDPHWKLTKAGGYNKCIMGSATESNTHNSVLPNCTGYAYGRFMEILGERTCKLSRGNAGSWYGYTADGYQRGSQPRLGAIICWAKIGGAGYVGVVEEIRADGSIVTSESSWNALWSNRFRLVVRNNRDGRWGADPTFVFQGFIYNPKVTQGYSSISLAQTFTSEALKHVGEDASWTWKTYGQSGIEWCAAFVSAVAQETGALNRYIYKTASASGLARESVRLGYGTFYKGPNQGTNHTPIAGDLIFFRYVNQSRPDIYSCEHVGIVVDYNSTTNEVTTVEGNTGTYDKHTSQVKKKSYSVSTSTISGYFHPNWQIVSTVPSNQLYSSVTTRKDMTLREIGYLDRQYQPSIHASSIKLSAINYTGLLGALFKLQSPAINQSTTVADTDKLSGNCRIIVNYLISKGLNAAAACGVAGNIFHESSFNTGAVGDYGTSFGICQWHNERGSAMKRMAGNSWATNLTGQLDYLWYELTTSYNSSTLTVLKGVKNDVTGCKQAADVFVRKFEVPADVDNKSIERQATAVSYFSQVTTM